MAEKRSFSMEELVAYCNQYGFIFRAVKYMGDLQTPGITVRLEHV